MSLPAVAMAFAALPACVARVVIGCSAAAEVEANIAHMEQSAMVSPKTQRAMILSSTNLQKRAAKSFTNGQWKAGFHFHRPQKV